METSINYLALASTIVLTMVIGALWYGPLFGKKWAALLGLTDDTTAVSKKEGMIGAYLGQMILSGVMLYVLARFLKLSGAFTAVEGMLVALWLWIGFILTTHSFAIFWEKRPIRLVALNVGYLLFVLTVSSVILTLWR